MITKSYWRVMLVNRNKEYRLKRKNQRKDYIIQDKNVKIKSLYYQNETKRNKIEQLQQQRDKYKEVIEEVRERLEYYLIGNMKYEDSQKEFKKLLQMLDKVKDVK